MKGSELVKDLENWVNKVKEKGSAAVEIARLKLKKNGLEKKITRLHTRLGERVEYLTDLGRDKIVEDEVVKGFLQEIKDLRKEIKEIDTKIEALKAAEPEAEAKAQAIQEEMEKEASGEETSQEKQEN